jgi:hypothetical protein
VALAVVELQQTREAICSAIERKLYLWVQGCLSCEKCKKLLKMSYSSDPPRRSRFLLHTGSIEVGYVRFGKGRIGQLGMSKI